MSASYSIAETKRAAQGRAVELLERVAGIPRESLDGCHHPCPRCGGRDRFRLIDADAGAVLCNKCFATNNGDWLAAVQWMNDCTLGEAIDLANDHLGLPGRRGSNGHHANGNGHTVDVLEAVAKAKRMPLEAFKRFGAAEAKRGNLTVARIPAYNEHGEPHSYFDLTPDGKGWFKRGKGNAGLFFPGRLPQPGENWLLVEGCKDAAALVALGYNAAGLPTCKLHQKYAALFTGCHIVLVPDLDAAGIEGAETAAARLAGAATSVKIARLPGEVKPSGGADCRDVLAMPNGEQLLREAIDAAEPWTGEARQDDAPRGPVPICNFEEREGPEGKPVYDPLPMSSIITRIRQRCDDWPRRCGPALFVHDTNGLDWLDSPPALFGWLQSRTGIVEWRRGSGYVTKEELHAELRRTATEYAAVETFPHEPPIAEHYYTCPIPAPGDGSALAGLLDRFTPETSIDRDLIQAFGMTLAWGGRGGFRPAFIFTSDAGRGVGKTTIPAIFGHLLGGLIDFSTGDKIADIKSRLLSPEALGKRLALLDNVKSLRFSWAELEALITAPLISGRRLYVGEASRPNLLTWAITVNGASLATDLAQRAVIIKLRKPKHSTGWQEETIAYIDQHRDRIIADLIGALQADREELRQASRWGGWERDILARLPEPNEAAKVIAERREAVDVEAEESSIVEEYFEQQIDALHYDGSSRVFIPSRIAAKWWAEAIGDRGVTVTAAVRQLKQKIDEGCIRRLAVSPSRAHGRGFIWTNEDASLETGTAYDIEARINYQTTHWGS